MAVEVVAGAAIAAQVAIAAASVEAAATVVVEAVVIAEAVVEGAVAPTAVIAEAAAVDAAIGKAVPQIKLRAHTQLRAESITVFLLGRLLGRGVRRGGSLGSAFYVFGLRVFDLFHPAA